MTLSNSLKQKIYSTTLAVLHERIAMAEAAMRSAQDAANNETKSSAGDKYETGRAMMQLEKQKSAAQLNEATKLLQILQRLNPEKTEETVKLASLVKTNAGVFYISVPTGKFLVEGVQGFAISPYSPIGKVFDGKQAGESVNFNGRKYQIEEVV